MRKWIRSAGKSAPATQRDSTEKNSIEENRAIFADSHSGPTVRFSIMARLHASLYQHSRGTFLGLECVRIVGIVSAFQWSRVRPERLEHKKKSRTRPSPAHKRGTNGNPRQTAKHESCQSVNARGAGYVRGLQVALGLVHTPRI